MQILGALNSHSLEANPSKCEIFLIKPQSNECIHALRSFKSITDCVKQVEKCDLTLLSTPIFPEAILGVLEQNLKISN